MDKRSIKEYIIINNSLEDILYELGCHHIKERDGGRYYSCGFPNGDNPQGMSILTENLHVEAYTKDISDEYGNSDIVSLVCYIKDMYFYQALRWICSVLGIDYYTEEVEDIPTSLQLTNMIFDMNENITGELEEKLVPKNENLLKTYFPYCNNLFLKDGVDYKTQEEFEIGIDLESERITIPIRDELGSLVGVKGRYFYKDIPNGVEKYIYLERCSKSKILYGLYKTIDYIKESKKCIVVESEKSVLVLWANGIKNVVSASGHCLSETQVEKITRLGVNEVILCYDQDVARKDNGKIDREEYLKEANKFLDCIRVSAMVDLKNNILGLKESPVDNIDNFNKMYYERKVLQHGEKIIDNK